MDTAKYVKHKIYPDKVVELKVLCPYCGSANFHTITKEYITNIYGPRVCNNLTCNQYNLPKFKKI